MFLTPVFNNKAKLRVFAHNEKSFIHNGLGILYDAVEPKLTISLEGTRTLEFQLDFNSPNWQYIKHANIVLAEGQLFRIAEFNRKNSGDEPSIVKGYHVFADSAFIPLNYFPLDTDEEGIPVEVKTDTVRNHLVSAFKDSRFNILTEEEVADRGMLWVTDLVDFESDGKLSAGDVLSRVFSKIERGELFVDNWSIAIVERVGNNKGVKLSETVNTQAVDESSDYSDVINVITVQGKDGLPLPDTFPNSVIRSEDSIRAFGERGGFLDYDQIEDSVELLAMAQYAISPTNPDRVDAPKVSLRVDYVDLSKMYKEYPSLGVGDTVYIPTHFMASDISEGRITEITYYPLSPENSSITIGNPPRSLTDYLSASILAGEGFKKITDETGKIKMSWLDGIKAVKRSYINSLLKRLQVVIHKTGDVWVDPNDEAKALFIGAGQMAFANKFTPEGDWAWNTFLSATDITTDQVYAAQLNTGVLKIADDNGYFNIFSSMMEMYSENPDDPDNPLIRFMAGVDPEDNDFKFVIYNQFGEPVVYMDAQGQMQIKGRIETGAILTYDLYAERGDISQLTVDQVQTSDFLALYNLKNNLPVNYIKMHNQWIEYYTAEVIGASDGGVGATVQLTNRQGDFMYWQDNPNQEGAYVDTDGNLRKENGQQILLTSADTGYPVYIYKYNTKLKMKQGFTDGGNPYIEFGVGTGVSSNGKGVIIKTSTGFELKYVSTEGIEYGLRFSEGGVELINADELIRQFRLANQPLKIEVLDADPINPEIGRIWMINTPV